MGDVIWPKKKANHDRELEKLISIPCAFVPSRDQGLRSRKDGRALRVLLSSGSQPSSNLVFKKTTHTHTLTIPVTGHLSSAVSDGAIRRSRQVLLNRLPGRGGWATGVKLNQWDNTVSEG